MRGKFMVFSKSRHCHGGKKYKQKSTLAPYHQALIAIIFIAFEGAPVPAARRPPWPEPTVHAWALRVQRWQAPAPWRGPLAARATRGAGTKDSPGHARTKALRARPAATPAATDRAPARSRCAALPARRERVPRPPPGPRPSTPAGNRQTDGGSAWSTCGDCRRQHGWWPPTRRNLLTPVNP